MFSIHFAPHQRPQQPMILHVILGTNPDIDPDKNILDLLKRLEIAE